MDTNALLRYLMYAAQGYDAVNSAKSFQLGAQETNPLMRPFSHAGAPGMALGFGLEDLAEDKVMQHTSQGQKNTAELLQILANVMGILQTNRNRMGGNVPFNPVIPAAGAASVALPLLGVKF